MINNETLAERIIIAPVMVPGLAIPRYHKEIGDFDICFSSEYIHELYRMTDKSKIITTLHHNGKVIRCQVISSFVKGLDIRNQIERELPSLNYLEINYFEKKLINLPKGTWLQVRQFESKAEIELLIKSGIKGASIELPHTIEVNGIKINFTEEYERMDSKKDQLPYTFHIYGGSVWSWGRNEHGPAHFELKKDGKPIDKIFIPSTKSWNAANRKRKIDLLNSENNLISKKERKKIAEWLDSGDNLSRCQATWNKNNKDNKERVMFVY